MNEHHNEGFDMQTKGPIYISFNGLFRVFAFVALIFTGLKVFGFISWSWIWILSPLWIFFILLFAFIVFVIIAKIIIEVFDL